MSTSRDDRYGELERPVLDPFDRASESLFGLIMALTFTCTLSAATVQGDVVLTVAIGAPPLRSALSMVALGFGLVAITILLGG